MSLKDRKIRQINFQKDFMWPYEHEAFYTHFIAKHFFKSLSDNCRTVKDSR